MTALADYLFRTLAPPPPSPEDTLRTALRSMDELIAGANGEADVLRGRFARILQDALGRLGAAGSGGVTDTIDSASDEEIFALIDNEL
ncbi:hypothetical protein JOL79_28655 [Microbispora sp. RL4-1S]|uniref:Uncharacterized protein n=1 Tax=Microbispora oryzae TaxID=2806554 RepID=A0A940WLM8_9ACTN|nr:hypothetical protein [Microbispora oryzae]